MKTRMETQLTKQTEEYLLGLGSFIPSRLPLNPIEEQELILVAKTNKIEDILNLKIRSFEDLRTNSCCDIESLIKFDSEKQAHGIVYAILRKYTAAYQMTISSDSLDLLSDELIISYPGLRFTDIILLSRMACSGKLGTIFKELRVDSFFGEKGFVKTYLNAKSEFMENELRKKINELVKPIEKKDVIPMPEKYKTKYMAVGKPKEKNIYYRSINHYCEVNNIDFNELDLHLMDKWKKEYSNEGIKQAVTYVEYVEIQKIQYLYKLNNSNTIR